MSQLGESTNKPSKKRVMKHSFRHRSREYHLLLRYPLGSKWSGKRQKMRPTFLVWRESATTAEQSSRSLETPKPQEHLWLLHIRSYLLCSCSAMRRSAKRSLLQFWRGSKLSSFTVTLLPPHIKLQGEEEEFLRDVFCSIFSQLQDCLQVIL